MAQLNTVTYGDTVDLIKREMSIVNDAMFESPLEEIFQVSMKPYNTGDSIRFDEFDSEEYADEKPEGTDAKYADYAFGYNKDIKIKTFSKHVKITKEMRVMQKYDKIARKIYDVAKFCPQRLDLEGANMLANADSTSFTNRDGKTIDISGGDSKAIVASDHTLTQSSTTWSNVITGNPEFDAGGDALNLALSVGRNNSYNHFGENIPANYDTILTSDNEEIVENVQILLRSRSWVNPATASNTSGQNEGVINPKYGRFRHIIWPRLGFDSSGGRDTDNEKAWFLIDSENFDGHLVYLERPHMVEKDTSAKGAEGAGYDVSSYDWEFGSTVMAGIGIVSGRRILGSFPA